jgi:hypothetical protein
MLRLALLSAGLLTLALSTPRNTGKQAEPPALALGSRRPFLAIWRESQGFAPGAPYLRVAFWDDGRVVFSKHPEVWSDALCEGTISPEEISQLKRAVTGTGVFDLLGNCYLVPDAPVDCITVEVGGRKQMLYWDEVESPNYGINSNPKPQHLKFKACWKAVNQLALRARPEKGSPVKGKFIAPRGWYLKPSIQSE